MHAYLYEPCSRNVMLYSRAPLDEEDAFVMYMTVTDDSATEQCECILLGEVDETNQLAWLTGVDEYDDHVVVTWVDFEYVIQTAKFALQDTLALAFTQLTVDKYGFAVIEIVQH